MRTRTGDSTLDRALDDLQVSIDRQGAAGAARLARFRAAPRVCTASFAVTVDDLVVVYTGPGNHSAQLPRSGGRSDAQMLLIVNASLVAITARPVSGELIDGATSQSLAANRAHMLLSDARGGWYHWAS